MRLPCQSPDVRAKILGQQMKFFLNHMHQIDLDKPLSSSEKQIIYKLNFSELAEKSNDTINKHFNVKITDSLQIASEKFYSGIKRSKGETLLYSLLRNQFSSCADLDPRRFYSNSIQLNDRELINFIRELLLEHISSTSSKSYFAINGFSHAPEDFAIVIFLSQQDNRTLFNMKKIREMGVRSNIYDKTQLTHKKTLDMILANSLEKLNLDSASLNNRKSGFLYMMENLDANEFKFKIGFSKDPKMRNKKLNSSTALAVPLSLIKQWPIKGFQIETEVHDELVKSGFNRKKEFFAGSKDDIEKVIENFLMNN